MRRGYRVRAGRSRSPAVSDQNPSRKRTLGPLSVPCNGATPAARLGDHRLGDHRFGDHGQMNPRLITADELVGDPFYPQLKEYLVKSTGLAYYADKDVDLARRVERRLS